ncbi:MAG: protein translocase subunit SecDF [Bacteroidales bacterium]|nr:protein translocase subunit SecDF [Bacteroidales bacterium]
MQNKGFVKVFAVLLTLVCAYYLSFSIANNYIETKAEKIAQGDKTKLAYYLDSLETEKVYMGQTYAECRENVINLGLDLKGGMNVVLEVSVPDIIRSLSNNNPDVNFNKAMASAIKRQTESQKEFIDLFVEEYKKIDTGARLSAVFSTFEMKGRIDPQTKDEDVIKVLRTEVQAAIQNSFNVLRTRIDRFGVVQPNLQQLGTSGRILVELPGIKEPDRVRKLLQGSANLEFWETYELGEIYESLIAANNVIRDDKKSLGQPKVAASDSTVALSTLAKPAVSKADTIKSTAESDKLLAKLGEKDTASQSKSAEDWKKEYPLFSILQINQSKSGVGSGPVVGYAFGRDTAIVNTYLSSKRVKDVLPRDLKFVWTVNSMDKKTPLYQLIALKVTTRDGKPVLQGDVITDASDDFQQNTGSAKVNMTMNAEGAKTWARLTKENMGRSIAIVLDGFAYSFPRVQSEITGGSSEITGNFTAAEAKDLANVLKSGKMPAPCHIVQEDVVGPSLGKEAIHDGFISFIIAFVLILLYMQLNYGVKPGLIVDASLLINMFFLLGILASFQAVLTLPGIAGMVLTLGMAVDANVLIYERIKEELAAGKTIKKAVADGYKNALSAIMDGNITTLLTGIILFYFGTGPIRGFATTLIIGIITSVFSGVFVTHLIFEALLAKEKMLNETFTTRFTKNLLKSPKIDFIGKRKVGYILSGTVLTICVLFIVFKGLDKGVDFSGGRNYVIRFEQPVTTEDVRNSLESNFEGYSLSVITIGSPNQVRITTNYKIDDNSTTIDNEVEGLLYKSLKPYLKGEVTSTQFVSQNIMNSQKVGPTVADDVTKAALWAVFLSVIVMGLYILMRFKNIAFSAGTVAALFHDVLLIVGCYAIFSSVLPFSLEIDQTFIAAILTIIGYSVNDTVVIFDRVREMLGYYPKRNKKRLLNEALNVTLVRTFSTSLTVFITLLSIFILGGDTIRGFAFAMLIGTLTGIYSTLFIAVPVAYEVQKKQLKIVDDDYDDEVKKN